MTKYGNQQTLYDGRLYASKAEAKRAGELQLLERAGRIRELRYQVPFTLEVNGTKVCRYVADFVYLEGGRVVVEDVKGTPTPTYRLKKKLFEACLAPLKITEVAA